MTMFNILYNHPGIVATLGPNSSHKEVLEAMVASGLQVARFNFSHGSYEEHRARLHVLREVAHERGTTLIALADLCGPKVRVTHLQGEALTLREGAVVRIVDSVDRVGEDSFITSYAHLFEEVNAGMRILLDDGKMVLEVERIEDNDVLARVCTGGFLYKEKGVNVPGAFSKLHALTEKDKADLKVILEDGYDAVALSFVRKESDIDELKQMMGTYGTKILPIVAKIETKESLTHLDAITKHVSAVMVARGDLGVEVGLAHVPLYQKEICKTARRHHIPVIVATQVLQSMVEASSPTRAEVGDVVTALLDGASYIMLSDETTIGKHPALCVATCRDIVSGYNVTDTSSDEEVAENTF